MTAPELSLADQGVLQEAATELLDCIEVATGELEGYTASQQVDLTRAAIRKAQKVLTKWRAADQVRARLRTHAVTRGHTRSHAVTHGHTRSHTSASRRSPR